MTKSVWGPLLLRGVAAGIALAGLAGIGVAASRSPELTPLPAALPSVQLAGLSSSAPLGLSPGGAALSVGARVQPAADAGAAPARTCPCEVQMPHEPCDKRRSKAASSQRAALDPVSLNQASASELTKLPGVGARRAQAIIELRQRLGGLRRVSDLLRIKGIGPRMLERLRPHVVLDAARAVDPAAATPPAP